MMLPINQKEQLNGSKVVKYWENFMNDLKHKLSVLAIIAKKFNEEKIIWAVGASLLLYLKGKIAFFHDIDIMIVDRDVNKAKTIISKLGKIKTPNPNPKYQTKHFIEYVIDGVEIDILGGFQIIKNGIGYDCSLKENQIVEKVVINEQLIPLQSLKLWKYYYELMDREDKVKLLSENDNK